MTVVFTSMRGFTSTAPAAPMPVGLKSLQPRDLVSLPEATLSCLIDLGLTSEEIARYLSLDQTRVGRIAANLHATVIKP